MKKIIFILLLLSNLYVNAQKNDNVWIIGYQYCGGCPVSALDFTYGSPDTVGIYSGLDANATSSMISDSTGLFQFNTNGIYVCNKYGQVIPGSIDFNLDAGAVSNGWTYYMPYYQCAITVPFPDHPNQYYIFHLSGRDWGNFTQPCRMAYSTIDMNANSGSGQMLLKNQTAINDTLLYSTMQAVKHGNGRDWWIVAHEWNNSGMYAALLTPDSVTTIVRSTTGPSIRRGISVGQSQFSPDGSKYAIASRDSSLLIIYNFDRCTGEFIFNTVIRHVYNTTGFNFASCVFSPNGKYLYASDHRNVYQFNTDTIDIAASEKIVGTLVSGTSYFFKFCNAPDGKIYQSSWGSDDHLSVINDPDQPDTACHFGERQFKVMYMENNLPDFPNFKLGPLTGCDSLTNYVDQINLSNETVFVYPNPSSGIFKFTASGKIKKILIMSSEMKLIKTVTENNSVDLKNASEGLYFYIVETEDKLLNGKLIKVRE